MQRQLKRLGTLTDELLDRAAPVRHFGGLGLGLWISKQIVETRGDVIRVESEACFGSTFTVELPRAAPAR